MSPSPAPALRRELRLWHLVLFNLSAIAGVRWLAAAAHAGPGSLTLWLLAAVAFFLPSALVVSSLSARFPEEGGFYVWTKHAFGPWHGFLCAWVYFVSNILYFPTLLLSGVAMASYMFGQNGVRYSENPVYAIPVTVAVLWLAFLVNLVGLRVGKWPGLMGGVSTYLIAALLCGFGFPRENNVRPFLTVGFGPSFYTPNDQATAAGRAFDPSFGLSNFSSDTRLTFNYGAGVKWKVHPHIGLRVDVCGLVGSNPKFSLPSSSTTGGAFILSDKHIQGVQATVGLSLYFGRLSGPPAPPPPPPPPPPPARSLTAGSITASANSVCSGEVITFTSNASDSLVTV